MSRFNYRAFFDAESWRKKEEYTKVNKAKRARELDTAVHDALNKVMRREVLENLTPAHLAELDQRLQKARWQLELFTGDE